VKVNVGVTIGVTAVGPGGGGGGGAITIGTHAPFLSSCPAGQLVIGGGPTTIGTHVPFFISCPAGHTSNLGVIGVNTPGKSVLVSGSVVLGSSVLVVTIPALLIFVSTSVGVIGFCVPAAVIGLNMPG
jgi:hypothetical protein